MMHSDDSSPQPSRPRPAWQIWAIVGGAAALVAVVGVIAIFTLADNGDDDGLVTGPLGQVAAVEQLRSHLPDDLRSADDCAETSPLSYATSTVECRWPSSHVPHTATYSLYEEDTSMLRSAMTLVRGSGGYGSSCTSVNDFDGSGGQMLWERDSRERGTVWCYLNRNDEPVILWTDTAPRILASAVASGKESAAELLKWFNAKGQASLEPVPSPPPLRRPTPTVSASKSPPVTSDPSEPPTTSSPTVGPPTDRPTTGGPPSTPDIKPT